MAEICSLMLENLTNAGIGILIFLLGYIANVSFSLYYNIKVLGQSFNKEQMWNSFLRIVTFAVGICCLVVVITALPLFANYMGLPLPDEFVNNLTMVAIIGFPLYLASKYALMAFEKMKKILESGTITLSDFEEDSIQEASLKEVEDNKKLYDKIVNALKEAIEVTKEYEESMKKDIEETIETTVETTIENTIEETTEQAVNEIKEEIKDADFFLDYSEQDIKEDSENGSQEEPDEVNFEEMEKNQLEE